MSAGAEQPVLVHPPYTGPDDSFSGECAACGEAGDFRRTRLSVAESFPCRGCGARLRYQGQARAIVRAFGRHGARSLAELVREPEFRRLRIFEPGTLGPFRRWFRDLGGYVQSVYDPATLQRPRRGVRTEDLMDLTFESETFDLVITSDVFEHVRRPTQGFAEVFRVLKPGGIHVFTVPGVWPLPPRTIARVDVSGDTDVAILPPIHHNGVHLVYHEFGLDLLEMLGEIGFVATPQPFQSNSPTTATHACFVAQRPLDRPDVLSHSLRRHGVIAKHPVRFRRRAWRAQRRLARRILKTR